MSSLIQSGSMSLALRRCAFQKKALTRQRRCVSSLQTWEKKKTQLKFGKRSFGASRWNKSVFAQVAVKSVVRHRHLLVLTGEW